jgi:L-serine dehydratase
VSIYPYAHFDAIYQDAKTQNIPLWQLAVQHEGVEILEFLKTEVWQVMKDAVQSGLTHDDVLPGTLQLKRRAKNFLAKSKEQTAEVRDLGEMFAYALAVSEENAAGSFIITDPTCGAAGLLPGIFYFMQQKKNFSDDDMAKALAVAGMFGIVIKKNASVSGAEAGCQAEIGSAASMAAAGVAYLLGATLEQQEYAAEIAMEHHLGLTCDPVDGLVQIPCIERNAVGSRRAYDAAHYAMFSEGGHRVSFDTVVATMHETGLNLKPEYRETSQGGLAKLFLKGS